MILCDVTVHKYVDRSLLGRRQYGPKQGIKLLAWLAVDWVNLSGHGESNWAVLIYID